MALDTEAFKAAQSETDRQMKAIQAETAKQIAETNRQIKAIQAEAARDTKELKQQIGGLGNKFGSFTEGLLLPAIETLLRKQYGMTNF